MPDKLMLMYCHTCYSATGFSVLQAMCKCDFGRCTYFSRILLSMLVCRHSIKGAVGMIWKLLMERSFLEMALPSFSYYGVKFTVRSEFQFELTVSAPVWAYIDFGMLAHSCSSLTIQGISFIPWLVRRIHLVCQSQLGETQHPLNGGETEGGTEQRGRRRFVLPW